MNGVLTYTFPDDDSAVACVPHYSRHDEVFLSVPRKHFATHRLVESDLTADDIEFLNKCLITAREELEKQGHTVVTS